MYKRRHKTIKQILALTLAVLLACQGNIVALADVQAPAVSEQITSAEKKTTPTETPRKAATKAAEKTPAEEPEKTPTETPKTTVTETPKTTVTKTPEKTPTEAPKETPTKAAEKTPAEAPETTSAEPAEETPEKAPADPVETVQQASDVALLAVGPHVCDGVTFDKELTVGGELAAGNYYLTGDLNISTEIEINTGEVKICLNGHTITMNAAGNVFTVSGSGKLTLYDCKGGGKVTHTSGINGIGVDVLSAGSTFIMNGGNIVGNKYPGDGGGINNKGTVEIHGGTIAGNSATGSNGKGGGIYSNSKLTIDGGEIMNNTAQSLTGGGGIYSSGKLTITNGSIHDNTAPGYGGGIIDNGGTTTISGGTISGNKSTNQSCGGGGICIVGTLTISGGKIENNTAAGSGGGIYVYRGGTATITGGEITGNTATKTAGGIYNEGTLTLNGAKIESNTAGGTGGGVWTKGTVTLRGNNDIWFNTNGKDYADNIYIPTGSYLTVSESVTGHLYVNTQVDPTSDQPVEFAKPGTGYTITDTDVSAFKSSTDGFVVKKNSAGNLELAVPAAEPHTCDGVTFDKVLTGGGKLAAGNYYLTGDLDISTKIEINTGEVKICLNGHNITMLESAGDDEIGEVLCVTNGGKLTLYDCQGTGQVTHAVGKTGTGVDVAAGCTFTMYGGNITGNTGTHGGIYNEGTLTIKNGSIHDNTASGYGGGIMVYRGTAKIQGGTISKNTSSGTYSGGGGVCVGGKLEISGGTISENTALQKGGGICIFSGATATITGGEIKSNKTTTNSPDLGGGGIYNEGNLTLNGATIESNETSGTGNGVRMDKAAGSNSTLTLLGNNKISYNQAEGIYLPAGRYVTIGGAITGSAGDVSIQTETEPTASASVVFAKPVNGHTITDTEKSIFESDNESYVVAQNSDGNLELTVKKTLTKDDFTMTPPSDLYYTGTAKTATVAANSGVTGVGTITVKYYDANNNEVAEPKAVGTYTVKITDSNGIVTDLEMGSFTITRIVKASGASVSSRLGENDWYIGNVTITPPSGWKISTTDTADTKAWLDKLTQTADVESTTVSYYLKDAQGHITESKTTGTIKKDATPPDINKAEATEIKDTTAKIVISAYDATSGIASYGYAIKDSTMTGTKDDSSGMQSFTLTGLTANTAYTATVSVTDKAGNKQTRDVTFTTTKTLITTAAVTITAPVKGATPDTTATVAADAPYTAGAVTWAPEATKFMGSQAYRATVYLTPAAGYEFNDSTTATIPGVDGGTYAYLQDNGTLQVFGDFPKTAASVLDKIDVYDYKKTTYEAMDKFDPTGLQLLLTNDDGSTSIVAYGDDTKGDFTFSPETMTMDTDKVTITYSEKTTTLNVTVTKKEVTAPTIAAKDYTGSTLTADVNDTADYTVTANAGGTDAGDYDVVLTLKDPANYQWPGSTSATKTLTFTINKVAQKPLAITGQPNATPTYGDSFTLGTTGGSGINPVTWAVTKGLATVGADGKVTVTGVGTVTITATRKADNNHTADVSDSYTVTVAKADLTITANDQTLTYGDAFVGNGVTYSGFVNGDTEAKLSGTLGYTTTYNTQSTVGSTQTLTPKGLTSSNYKITFAAGNLTVEQRVATLTWTGADERAYDGKASNVTATAGNLVNNETLTVTVTGGTETNVGSHTATATKLTGTTAANYKLPTTATKDYKIVQSATTLTATADKASYTYGDTIKVTANITPSGTAAATKALTVPTANQIALYYGTTQISDPVTAGADGKVTLTYATTEKTVPAGKQNLTVKYTGNDNMADATADVSVTIAKKEVTAPTIAAADYTGKTQTATVAANELYKVTKNAGGTDVGDYDVVLTLTDAKNYTWPKSDNAALTLKFTINKVAQAGLTIKDQPTTVTYGDAAFTLKTEGGSGTGAVTWSAEGKATVDKAGKATITGAGEAIITATKAADGNHTEAVTATYKVTVAKKALTVTAKDHTITYGDKPAGNGVDYDGFAKGDDAGKLSGTLAYDHTYQQYGDVGANYKITPKGLTSDNYNITFKAGTLTVEQLEATFTWNNVKERVYDGKASNVTAAVQNAQNNDAITVTVTGGTETEAGTHTATITGLTGTKAGNYKMPETNPTQTYSIVQSASDVTDIKADKASYVYGETVTITAKVKAKAVGEEKKSGLFAMLAALVAPTKNQVALYQGTTQISEAVDVGDDGSCTLTYDTKDKKLSVGNNTLTLKYVGNDNMAAGEATVSVTLTAKKVTAKVSNTTTITKVYDGTDTADVTLAVETKDLVDAKDQVTVTAPAVYADANVGTGKAITLDATKKVVGGTEASCYDVSLPTGVTGDITAKPLTATVAAAKKDYDGNTTATVTATVETGVKGEALSISGLTGTFDTKDAGKDKTVTVDHGSAAVTGAAKDNYTITYAGTVKAEIARRAATVTAEAKSKDYGATDPALTFKATNLAAGETLSGALTRDAGEDAGNYDITQGTVTDAENANYTITFTKGVFTINTVEQEALTIKDGPDKVTYGDAAFTVKTEGGSGTGAVTWGADGKATVDKNGKVTIIGAGAVTITATKAADGNHTKDVSATYKVTVAKKGLTVTAKDHTITYGAEPAGNGVDYDGFVEGDDAKKLGGTLAYDHTCQQYGDVGADYKITPKGLTSDNYDITYETGTLTVEQLEAAFTWSNTETRAYDGKESKVTAAVNNLQDKDAITVEVTGGKETEAGTHTATITGLKGEKAGNYKLPKVLTQEYKIVQSASEVTKIQADKDSYIYGDIVTVNANLAPTGNAPKEKGLFAILAELVTPAANQAALYSGETQISEAVTVGEDGSCALTYDTKDKKLPVGTTTLTLRYVGNHNMADAVTTINVTIAPKPVTVSAADQIKNYGEKDPEWTYTVNGLLGEDTLSGALTREQGEDVKDGGYAITQGTLTNTGNPNYNITYTQGTLTISPIAQDALKITGMPKEAVYGDAPFELGTTGGSGKGKVTWTANGPATVDKDGKVTITGAGDVTIIAAKAADGNHTGQVTAAAAVKVAKKALTWDTTVLNVSTEKHWDGNANAAVSGTLKVAGMVGTDDPGFAYDEVTASYEGVEAGNYKITVTAKNAKLANGNYTLPTARIIYEGKIVSAAPGANETWKPEGSNDVYRLVLEEGVSIVPSGLEDTAFDTPEKITKQMKVVVSSNKGYNEKDTKVYDVELQVSPDGGTTWTKASKENFPAEGLKVRMAYPEGTNANNFDFVVTHMFTESINGHKAGEIETPAVTKTEKYIEFTVMGLSPIAIAWKPAAKQTTNDTTKKPANTTTNTKTPVKPTYAAKTGDDSQTMMWILLLLASGMSITGVVITRRRRCKK